jgi:hypothetical protein
MRHFFVILLFLSSNFSFGQRSNFRPFKMIIVSPDTAIIDEGLKIFVDTVQADYLKMYYNTIKQMERFVNYTDDQKMKKEYEEKIKVAKQSEQEVKKFKYFETIPDYSYSVLQMYFNEYPPNSTFQVVRARDLKSINLKDIADNYKADYVVSYKDIHTNKLDNGLLTMNVTTILFANKDSKVLFEKQGNGDMNSYGDMWTCMNPLSCLLITSVKSSTTDIFETVSKRQKK